MSTDPILSIIVISHNQCEELRRCIDSILAMPLSYTHEIIISDDRSTDGTYELAQEYAKRYSAPDSTTSICKLIRIVALSCNSDVCAPANNSQRSGYNRCNAYPYACGKYIAHVDADDYFRMNATVYERQIEALEQHPECALAMSDCLCVEEDEPIEKGKPWGFNRKMVDGEVLNPKEFIEGDYFRINQCFLQRRQVDIDPVALYGKRYVDSVITYHHLLFGNVVYVDNCDYVYVGHATSVTGQMARDNNDAAITWCLAIYIPAIIPYWKRYFLTKLYYAELRRIITLAISGYQLQPQNIQGLRGMNVFIYDCFDKSCHNHGKQRLARIDRWRLQAANVLMTIGNRLNIYEPLSGLLYRLLIR